MRRALGLFGIVAIMFAAAFPGPVLSAAERVTVRAGEHPGFSRLVFDWSRPAKVRLEQSPGQARLIFDRAGELNAERVLRDLPPGVHGLKAEGNGDRLTVVVAIAPDAKLRLMEVDSSTVLDVMRPDTPSDATPTPWPNKADQTTPTAKDQSPASTMKAPAVAKQPVPEKGAPISLLQPPAPVKAAPEKGQGATSATESKTQAGPAETPVPLPERKPKPPTSKKQTDAKAAAPSPPTALAPVEKAPVAGAANAETKQDNLVLVLADRRPTRIGDSSDDASVMDRNAPMRPSNNLRFQWRKDAALAAFRQGPNLWLVFDQASPGDVAAALHDLAPDLVPIEQLKVPGATVVRLTAPPVLVPTIARDGTTWVVQLWPYGPRPAGAVEVDLNTSDNPADVVFRTKTPGRAVSFTDPETGAELVVVPSQTVGQGLATEQTFPEFRALESYQGLALELTGDGVKVATEGEAVRVTHDAGLIVSRGSTLAISPTAVRKLALGPRLFDLETWRGDGASAYFAARQAAQDEVITAPPEHVAAARLDLARFYFANGFAAEALGELALAGAADPPVRMDPEVRLIRGASSFLAGDYGGAANDIFHPSLAGEAEAELWNAALAAIGLDWNVAAEKFSGAADLIPAYPHWVRTRLWLLAAESYLGSGDTEKAGSLLEQARRDGPSLDEVAQIAVLVARRLQMTGDLAGAKALYQRVVDFGSNRGSKVRARMALLDMAMQDGSMTREQAIAELERLRFAWRGDHVEVAMLQRLADLYLAERDYRSALRALRQATAAFPDTRLAQDVAQRMRDTFYDLFVGPVGEAMAPLNALALYEEFKELTPPGARGDRLILRLVDRLVDVDLLPRAADLLSTEVKFRLSGTEKADSGARLAQIYLMDRKPEQAMAALSMSEEPGLPDDMRRKRSYVRARALADQYRYDDALKLLAADDSPEALRLRADLLWEQANWPAVVIALDQLVPPAPPTDRPLSANESRNVADLAVALTLSGERDKLIALDKAYGTAMNGAADHDTFSLLAGGLNSSTAKSIAQELADVQRAEDFITDYRDRVQQASAKPSK